MSDSIRRIRPLGSVTTNRAFPFRYQSRGLGHGLIQVTEAKAKRWWRVKRWLFSFTLSINPARSATGSSTYSKTWVMDRPGVPAAGERKLLLPGLHDDVVDPIPTFGPFGWLGGDAIFEGEGGDDVFANGFSASTSLQLFADGFTMPADGVIGPRLSLAMAFSTNGEGYFNFLGPIAPPGWAGADVTGVFSGQIDGETFTMNWDAGPGNVDLFEGTPGLTLSPLEYYDFDGARSSATDAILVTGLESDRTNTP